MKKSNLNDILSGQSLIYKSSNESIYITKIDQIGKYILIRGAAKSDSVEGWYYSVEVECDYSGNIMLGRCDCPSYKYYGDPCKHELRIRNVFQKNRKKFGYG